MTINETPWHDMDISFSGCGFLGLYHVGVAIAIRKFGPQCFAGKVCGASAGALAAAAIACDLDLNESTIRVLELAIKARENPFNSFSRNFDVNKMLTKLLTDLLPDDCHIKATNRLYISVTQWSDWTNKLINQYNSKEDVIQAIICSCFIPIWSGMDIPTFNGVKYVDGVFSANLPLRNDHTITVSPFSGSHNICPLDRSERFVEIDVTNTRIALTTENLYRMYRVLVAPEPDELIEMLYQGFDDALRYMRKNNNKIHCGRCMTFEVKLSVDDRDNGDVVSPTLQQQSDSMIANESEEVHSGGEMSVALPVVDLNRDNGTQTDINNDSDEEFDNLSKSIHSFLYHNPEISWFSKIYRLLTLENIERFRNFVLQQEIQAKNNVLALKSDIFGDICHSFVRFFHFLYSFALKIYPFNKNSGPKVSSSEQTGNISPRVSISCHVGINQIDHSNQSKTSRHKNSVSHYRKDFVSGLMSSARIMPKPKQAIVKRVHYLLNPKQLKTSETISTDMDVTMDVTDGHLPETADLSHSDDTGDRQHSRIKSKPELVQRRNSFSQIECCSRQRFTEGVIRANTLQRRNSIEMNFDLFYKLNKDSNQTSNEKSNETIHKECETCKTKVKSAVDHMHCMSQTYAEDLTRIALELEHEKIVNHHHNERAHDIDDVIDFTKTHEAMLAFYYMNDVKEVKVTKLYDIQDNEDLLEVEEEEPELELLPSTSGHTVSGNTTSPEKTLRKQSVHYPEEVKITKLYDVKDNEDLPEVEEPELKSQPATSGHTVSANTTPPEKRRRKRSVYNRPEGIDIVISGYTSQQN